MSIVLTSLGYETPNGTKIFDDLHLVLEPGKKYGLVGPNGVGKSTLAKIIAGKISATSGSCRSKLKLFYFEQDIPPSADNKNLSGGEWMQFRLSQATRSDWEFIIFDEPTNNLDTLHKKQFTEFVKNFEGGLLIISHDRKLLECVDIILELSNRGLSKFGGNWNFYEAQSRIERQNLENDIRKSQRGILNTKKQRAEAIASQEKRTRHGKTRAADKGLSKIEVSGMKRKSQVTASKIDQLTQSKHTSSIEKSKEALDRLKVTPQIYADFPETKLENAKLVFEAQDLNFLYNGSKKQLWKKPITVSIRGPRKVSIEGKNGSGKSTFLKLLMGMPSIPGQLSGKLKLGHLNFSYLDQSLHLLDLTQTVLENVRSSSKKDQSTLRNLLAQFLFSGEKVNQVTQTLSGGEKLRLALAKSILADPAPQLLILDEPTNNIDVSNLEFLEVALAEFKGAIIAVSHDAVFLENLGIDQRINLEDHI